jgi:pimeloyl-ACP methyl ester carboxylesterase
MVDLGTHSLHIRCVGQGRPVVVIDAGHGDEASAWYAFQDQLAAEARVCTYDRAGYGRSEPWPISRHSRHEAAELKLLLGNAGLDGPYLLVGHSLGGLNAQVFAGEYPDLVAGMVLLDPPPLDFVTGKAFPDLQKMLAEQVAQLQADAERAARASSAAGKAHAAYLGAIADELRMLVTESGAQAAAVGSFGDTPLVVLASGRPNAAFGDQAEPYQQFWIEQSRTLAAKSTRGSFVLIPESGHRLHEDAPEQVFEAVREVLRQVRE